MMTGFTDIHSHFLYGVDDGAKTIEVMEAMLDSAYSDGIRRLVATPHVTPGMEPFDKELLQSRLDDAKEYCSKMGYDIELHLGAENLYTPAFAGYAERNELISLGNSPYLLVEFIPNAALDEIWDAVDIISSEGYVPVLAHIERYKCFNFKEAKKLKNEYEVVFQMNCNTVVEDKGFFGNRKIEKFLKSGLISCLACDAHDCHRRRYNMHKAYEVLRNKYGAKFADNITGKIKTQTIG